MTRDELQSRIVGYLKRIAPDTEPGAIDVDVDFREALDIDSVDVLRLLTAIHDDLGVNVPDRDQRKVTTVRALTDYVAARVIP